MWFSSALMLGSSPLARGLPLRITTIRPPTRIIPARAGFTVTVPPTSAQPWDHPRSRGVYPTSAAPSPTKSGSSPLARGLPGADRVPDRRPVDHPRSRRVYSSGSGTGPRAAGSSPLARGLPGADRVPDRRPVDHPRSRRVYSSGSGTGPRAAGSSPLARGLRPVVRGEALLSGIIPARAGFTSRRYRRGRRRRDHPRSRGVYDRVAFQYGAIQGSSPLARGLRLHGAP